MKAMTRQQLAAKAGVSAKTLSRWMEAHREELEAQGLSPYGILPPSVVERVATIYCIDL